MRTDHPREDPLVELGYEVRDVNYKTLTKSIVWFFVFAAFSFGIGLVVYNFMYPDRNRATASNNAKVKRILPGKEVPLLQDNMLSKVELMDMREKEEAQLHGTGYIDSTDRSRVHIPIDRAIDLLVQRGLPRTHTQVPAVSRGNEVLDPAASRGNNAAPGQAPNPTTARDRIDATPMPPSKSETGH